jgi:hypothetical protein
MTAAIYNFDRSGGSEPIDETERLFSVLGRYTSAELLELPYVEEEPGFFELMRRLSGLCDTSRLMLQNFLAAIPPPVNDGRDRPGGQMHSHSREFSHNGRIPIAG